MKHMHMCSKGLLAAGATLALPGSAVPSTAIADPDFILDLPAGLACANFDLRIEITASPNQVYREFFDQSGNLVRYILAGNSTDICAELE